MLPGELATWVVLTETIEDVSDERRDPRVWLELTGTMTVPKGTQRSTVLKKLLAGQTSNGLEGGDVPQIPLDAGEQGKVHLVPAPELAEGVPVAARAAIVFDVVTP